MACYEVARADDITIMSTVDSHKRHEQSLNSKPPINLGVCPTNCLKDKRGKDGLRPSKRVHFKFTTIKCDILSKSQCKPDNRAVKVLILLSQGPSTTINISSKSKLCILWVFRFFGNVHNCAMETDLCWMDGDGDVNWWGHLVPWQTEIRVHMLININPYYLHDRNDVKFLRLFHCLYSEVV